jgi:glucose-1-phosphate thymidylyltransferase
VEGQPVLITLDDTIFEMDLAAITQDGYSYIGAKEVDDPRRFGIIELENVREAHHDETSLVWKPHQRQRLMGFIKRLIEKPENPPTNIAIVGVYYIQNSSLLFECLQKLIDEDIRTQNEYQLTDGLQLMLERGEKLKVAPVSDWHDCGKPETLLATNRYLLQKHSQNYSLSNSIIIPPVFIADTAEIENSLIGPYVSIAGGSKVKQAIIQDSIINENAKVENVLLTQSLIGENALVRGQYSRLNVGDSSQIELL